MTGETETPFWQRICESLFVKHPDWPSLVRDFPERLDPATCLSHTVSGEILTSMGIRAQGWVGDGIVTVAKPNPLRPGDFPMPQLRWAYLQFMAQFMVMEGLFNYLAEQGAAGPEWWPDGTVADLIGLVQTMAFYSAMLVIAEEGRLPEDEADAVPLIRDEVRKIIAVLLGKMGDYGQAFLRHGVVGMLYRIWDKIARYATLSAENRPGKFESRLDTARDMLGYSVLIWSILEGMKLSLATGGNVVKFPGGEGAK